MIRFIVLETDHRLVAAGAIESPERQFLTVDADVPELEALLKPAESLVIRQFQGIELLAKERPDAR